MKMRSRRVSWWPIRGAASLQRIFRIFSSVSIAEATPRPMMKGLLQVKGSASAFPWLVPLSAFKNGTLRAANVESGGARFEVAFPKLTV